MIFLIQMFGKQLIKFLWQWQWFQNIFGALIKYGKNYKIFQFCTFFDFFFRSNAFEVRSVDNRSLGIIHCEDRHALEQWLKYIETHIFRLNKKSIKMSNKYLHPSEKVSFFINEDYK